MRRLISFIGTIFLIAHGAFCQWTAPQPIDTASIYPGWGSSPLAVASGPQREIAVVASARNDTLYCYLSADNGRSFQRSVVAHGWRGGIMAGAYIRSVDGVGFDSQSNLFIFWVMIQYDEMVDFYSYRISKSTDGGKTFSLFWAAPYFGGLTSSSLVKGALFIDQEDYLHCIWDSVWLFDYGYMYTRISDRDSSDIYQTVLPTLPVTGFPASAALHTQGDTLHIALSAKDPGTSNTGLYYLCSIDMGTTFYPIVPIDTMAARNPAFLRQSNGEVLLVHTSGPPGSNQDTVMIVQRKVDSLFSDPLPLFENFGSYVYTPPAILSNDSSVFMAYSSFQGVRYYELHQLGGLPADSLILTGHSSPDFTIDSLGGKYLVSVYENRVYLSTKDVVLSVTENHEIPPEAFRLGQNFPNPFNPQTRIPFDIYHHGNVEIVIYDLLGREVARLMKEDKTPGSYVAEWNARGIASGTYFYSLKVQGTALTRKMNVMK